MGFLAQISAAGSDNQWRQALRGELERIRRQYALYPAAGASPSQTLHSATHTVREIAAHCLPLGIALVMHLYPLCALRCAPLPAVSIAGFKRRLLMNQVAERGLIVANGGSERAHGPHQSMSVALDGDGLRVTGTFEYVSLASVADLVLFSAPLAAALEGPARLREASRLTGLRPRELMQAFAGRAVTRQEFSNAVRTLAAFRRRLARRLKREPTR